MKKIVLIFKMLFLLSIGQINAQKGYCGIYENAEDFLSGKIIYGGKHTRIKPHATFKKESITIKQNDSTYTFLKKDIFGYINKDGASYRFFNNEIYPIINPNESILIYKIMSGTGMKNSPIKEEYFFSKTAGTDILPLNLKNIEKIFSADSVFEQMVEIYFKTDKELVEFDNIHNMYKLNRLFEISKTEK